MNEQVKAEVESVWQKLMEKRFKELEVRVEELEKKAVPTFGPPIGYTTDPDVLNNK